MSEQQATDKSLELRTLDEAQRWFRDSGLTVVDWSIKRGFNPALVYGVLHGKRKCLRGQSFRIAVALKLKLCAPNLD